MIGSWIKICIVPLADSLSGNEEARLLSVLSAGECEHFASITHLGRRINYLTAHALIRTMAAEHFNVVAREVPLDFKPAKKPLIHVAGHHISLSHSDRYAAVVLGNVEVGVDVEGYRRNSDVDALMQVNCSDAEKEKLLALSDDEERRIAYFKLWSLKEAFYKASGLGVVFKQTSFDLGETIECRFENQSLPEWKFLTQEIPQEHHLVVAYKGDQVKVHMELDGVTIGERYADFINA